MSGTQVAFLVAGVALLGLLAERVRASRRLAGRLREERRMTEHLEEIDRLRGDLVATVTHELKTPLMSLLGYAQLLRKQAETLTREQRAEYAATIEEQAEKVLRLIEDLLQSARLETGMGLQRAPLDLARIARDVARELGTGRGRRIEVEASPHDLGLFGDPGAMEHVVANMLDNAVKYSSPGTPVRVSIREGDGEVLLAVSDRGPGIPREDLPHVFERFRQSSGARGRSGVGLGLSIVRDLAGAHGGRVWAESEPGKGTTVTVALPLRRA